MPKGDAPHGQASHRRSTRALSAVFWSFFGVRRRKDYETDFTQLKPLEIVIAGLAGGLVFVIALILLVGWITG